MPNTYWDSFDCQIQCEEYYHDEDFFNENEEDYDDDDEYEQEFEPGRVHVGLFTLNP